MAVKIRLRQQGRNNRRSFRLVAADIRSPRDGKYLEALGWYNPHEEKLENQLFIDTTKLQKWLENGAILSPNAKALVAKIAPNIVHELNAKMHASKEKKAQKRRQLRKAGPNKTKAAPTKKAAPAKTVKTTKKAEAKAAISPAKKEAAKAAKKETSKTHDKAQAKEGSKQDA